MYSYKGSISFGFVYIPITLQVAVKENNISFNLLEKNTKSRIKYKKTCVDCDNKEVKNEDIVKGYEYDDGKFVIFEPEEFEKLKSKKDKSINIMQFVDINEIDPIYYDKTYYVIPNGAEKAYYLLLKAMEKEQKVAVCKVVLGTKEVLAIVRSKDNNLIFNTLHYYDEIQKAPAMDISEVSDNEMNMAVTLINVMTKDFNPKDYKDEYILKIQKAIEEKINGKEITTINDDNDSNIMDLMDALKESIKNLEKTKKTKKNVITSNKERLEANA